jgi:hypothetical protein
MVGVVIDTQKLRKDLDQLHEDTKTLGREVEKRVSALEGQLKEQGLHVGLAVASLGLVVAQTLSEHDVHPEVIRTLKKHAGKTYQDLRVYADRAAELFAPFVRALDKEFPSK